MGFYVDADCGVGWRFQERRIRVLGEWEEHSDFYGANQEMDVETRQAS